MDSERMPAAGIAVSYHQHPPSERYDAIVIGSGMGGLTAAALLAKHGGRRVLVLERHYTPGGFTHVFRRPGFEWDVGVHYIGQVRDPASPVRVIFDHLTGGSLRWRPMPDVYDRVVLGDRCFDFPAGREAFRRKMGDYFPGEAGAIDGYLKLVERCVRRSSLYFAEKALPPVLAGILGGGLRRPFLGYARRTTGEMLASLTANRELAAVLTAQWGDYGLPPGESSFGTHAIVTAHYFDGGSYPEGGAGRIVESIAPVIQEAGGRILVSAEVAGILTDTQGHACGVRMADGKEIRAGCVASDAGITNTLRRLLPPGMHGVAPILAQIDAIPPSTAHLCLYVGLEGTARELGLQGTNLWIYPGEDHDANVRKSAADPEAPFPAVYISFPSAKDPTFEQRFPGRSTVDVVTFAPYDWFRRWDDTGWKKRGPSYDGFKDHIVKRLLEVLYRWAPSTRGRVKHAELSTPLTTRHFTNYPRGEIYGLAHTPRRFELGCLRPRTPVPNLYLTGQDVTLCGVTGALSGGILCASAILGRNLFSVVSRR